MTKTPQYNVPELRFPEFEGEWEEKKIGELTTKIGSGKTPKGGSENYLSEGIPFFRSQNIQDGQLSLNELVFIDSNTDDSMRNSRSFHGDILLNITGASIGRSAINTLTSTHANLNQHVCIIRVKKEFNYEFLGKFLLSPQGKKEILKAQSGGSREGLNFKEISKIKLYIPNIFSEQEKIGNFFSKLDRQIELEEKKLELLEQQKKGYMQKIFSQELRFKDENGNEYPDWEERKLGSLFKKGKAGGTPKSSEIKYYNGKIPFLSISDITEQGKFINSTEKNITQEGLDNSTAWLVPINSINYAMYASVGYLSINKVEVATSQAIFNMVFDNYNLTEYIYYYLNHVRNKGILNKLVGTGTQSNLSASIMKNMIISLPSSDEMLKISEFFSELDKLLIVQFERFNKFNKLKQGLLQKMFI